MITDGKVAYTRLELARAASVGRNAILDEIHAGRLKAFRQGRKWLIPRKSAEEWLERRLEETAAQ